jgi:hypothetical protein
MLTGLLCGLLPAWQLSNADPNEALKEGATNSGPGLPTDSRASAAWDPWGR